MTSNPVRHKNILSKKKSLFLLFAVLILIVTVLFYPLVSRSKKAQMLAGNKRILSEDQFIIQKISSDLNMLFGLNINSPDYNMRKSEIVSSTRESSKDLKILSEEDKYQRSIIVGDPPILDQLKNDKSKIRKDKLRYIQLFELVVGNLLKYDEHTSILHNYDPAIDFGQGISESNKENIQERASMAKVNISKIKEQVSSLNIQTDNVQQSISSLQNMETKFLLLENQIGREEYEIAQQTLQEIISGYPEFRASLHTGLLSMLITGEGVEFFTLQNNLLEKYTYFTDSIAFEQSRL